MTHDVEFAGQSLGAPIDNPDIEFFNDPFWNMLQLIAWATTRDPALVHLASDNFRGQRSHFEEVNRPSGKRLCELPSGRINWLHVSVHAAHRATHEGIPARITEDIEREIVCAFEHGKLAVRGIAIGKSTPDNIVKEDWPYLELFEDDRLGICARNKGIPDKYELRYSGLNVKRDDALALWPRSISALPEFEAEQGIITLPAGTTYLPVAELPELIARALNPDARGQVPRVSYLVKYPVSADSTAHRGIPLDESDRRTFDQVCAELPRLHERATAEEVQPYLDKFNSQSAAVEWMVGACWDDPKHNADIVRLDVTAEHRAAITHARRSEQLRTVSPTTRLRVDENRGDADVSIDDLTSYVAQFGIGVRLAAPEWDSETRAAIAASPHWDERELEALSFGFPPKSYCDLSVPEDKRLKMRHAIEQACADGRLRAIRIDHESASAVYGPRWQIERANTVRWAVANCPEFPDWLASSDLQQIRAQQDAARRAEGRYTLREAADEIANNTGENADEFTKKLKQTVRDRALPVHRPGEHGRYYPETVTESYEEAYGDDLNAWLTANEPRIPWKFPQSPPGTERPKDESAEPASESRPLPQQRFQEEAILRVLRECGYDPQALPKNLPGKPGAKRGARSRLTFSPSVFEHAWERLRAAGEVENVD